MSSKFTTSARKKGEKKKKKQRRRGKDANVSTTLWICPDDLSLDLYISSLSQVFLGICFEAVVVKWEEEWEEEEEEEWQEIQGLPRQMQPKKMMYLCF